MQQLICTFNGDFAWAMVVGLDHILPNGDELTTYKFAPLKTA